MEFSEQWLDEELIELEKQMTTFYSQLNSLQRKIARCDESSSRKAEFLQRICALTPPDKYSKLLIDKAVTHKVQIERLSSFRLLMSIATKRRRLSGHKVEWFLNNKRSAQKYAQQKLVDIPHVYQQGVPLSDIQFRPMSVIKPLRGKSAIGIFLIRSEKEIYEVKSGAKLVGFKALSEVLQDFVRNGKLKADSWINEELIGDFHNETFQPARDLKFYCFYGKVAMILEVDRTAGSRYCEWLPDGTLADTERYKGRSFIGQGFTKEQLLQAEAFSLTIPVPFIRIDFLATKDRFVFGEFTPRPGQFNSFSDAFDRYLGEHYLAAEARLSKHAAIEWLERIT
ncbi:MAG: hypothetical protein LAT77_11100 [Aliidiomarina sp.]|uniref:ATP-grasp fold amidoligase family protein n=1 Tax=Aliidiomarina sp. TaxID=1872439 RepID=UPI0025C5DF0C|nr:ATP-grasp fold amidoligase family protein [Aliidiomarina sp.]MCH8502442.1 hypothetical protein [Aliidiomarina sp.]